MVFDLFNLIIPEFHLTVADKAGPSSGRITGNALGIKCVRDLMSQDRNKGTELFFERGIGRIDRICEDTGPDILYDVPPRISGVISQSSLALFTLLA